jgi:hypothetical protein
MGKRGSGSLVSSSSGLQMANGKDSSITEVDIIYLKNVLLKFVEAHTTGKTQVMSWGSGWAGLREAHATGKIDAQSSWAELPRSRRLQHLPVTHLTSLMQAASVALSFVCETFPNGAE